MRILFVAAVDFELDVARLLRAGTSDSFLCSGVGPEASSRALTAALAADAHFDLVVDLGIAGSYDGRFPVGAVVQVVTERYGGQRDDVLVNPAPPALFSSLPQAAGNTVPALDPRYRSVEADIETMEGAAFFEICLRHGLSFAEIRAVSNRVGETDHARWDIPRALRSLSGAIAMI